MTLSFFAARRRVAAGGDQSFKACRHGARAVYRLQQRALLAHLKPHSENTKSRIPQELGPEITRAVGGPPGDRTRDTLIKSQVLYH